MNVREHSRGHLRGRSRGGFRGPTRAHTRGPTRGVKFRSSRALYLSEYGRADFSEKSMGVSHGVRPTTCDISLENRANSLILKSFSEKGNALGLVPSSLPHTLGYACTVYNPTLRFRKATSLPKDYHPDVNATLLFPDIPRVDHTSGGGNLLPKFMPISFFRRVSRFRGVSGHLVLQQGYPSVYWHVAPSCPLIASKCEICISFRSCSDLVLDADHALEFLYPISFTGVHLVLQRFRHKWRISVFALFA